MFEKSVTSSLHKDGIARPFFISVIQRLSEHPILVGFKIIVHFRSISFVFSLKSFVQ